MKLRWIEEENVHNHMLHSMTNTLYLTKRVAERVKFSTWNIVEESDKKIVVDTVQIFDMKGKLLKTPLRLTATINENNISRLETLPLHLDWVDNIGSSVDFYKNPYNKDVHSFYPPSDVPLYESQHLFISSNKMAFIRTSENFWIPVQGGITWINSHKHRFPSFIHVEIERYRLSQELQV